MTGQNGYRLPAGAPVYRVERLASDLVAVARRAGNVAAVWAGRRIDPADREAVMLAVARANRCRYCSFVHGRWARRAGLDEADVTAIERGDLGALSGRRRAMVEYALALVGGGFRPVQSSLVDALVNECGPQAPTDVETVARVMTLANLAGNTYDALVGRWRGEPVPGSRVVDEVAVGSMFLAAAPAAVAGLSAWWRQSPLDLADAFFAFSSSMQLPAPLDRFRSVLAVVAHPDDESFGLGGVLGTLASSGTEVKVLCLTHGEASTLRTEAGGASGGDLGAVRAAEFSAAADHLGVAVSWLEDLPDGGLASAPEMHLDALVDAHLDGVDAIVVLEPSGVTGHADHRVATEAAERVAARRRLPVVEWGLAQEVVDELREELGVELAALDAGDRGPDGHIVELDVDRSLQWDAIECHASQNPGNPLLRRRLELQGRRELVRIRPAG